MRLRELKVGCFGGGTGLPSLLGGLKTQPLAARERRRHDVRQRRQLRAVCATSSACCRRATSSSARSRSRATRREARRVLLARLPTLEHARLGGHTGGNLLLSMMQRYSGDFLDRRRRAARAARLRRAACGRSSVEQASVCAEYGDGSLTRGEVEVDAAQYVGPAGPAASGSSRPWRSIRAVAEAIAGFDAAIIGPGSFYTSLMPIFLVRGVAEALADDARPGDPGRQPADRGARHGRLHGRRRRRAHRGGHRAPGRRRRHQHRRPRRRRVSSRYAPEHKEPLAAGDVPGHVEIVGGDFWTGEIARHDRRRLAYAMWSVLSRRLLSD